MKKFILYFLFASIPLTTFSQSGTKVLDEKNGFKELKIGDNYSKWQNELKYITSENDMDYYSFEGECCQSLFSTDVETILLGFNENSLHFIKILTATEKDYSESYESSEYKYLKGSFEEVLKEKGTEIMEDESGDVISVWEGANIYLLLRFELMGLRDFDGRWTQTSRCVVTFSKRPNLEEGF